MTYQTPITERTIFIKIQKYVSITYTNHFLLLIFYFSILDDVGVGRQGNRSVFVFYCLDMSKGLICVVRRGTEKTNDKLLNLY